MRNYIVRLEAEGKNKTILEENIANKIERGFENADEIYADGGVNTSSRQLTTLLGKRMNPPPLMKELSKPVFASPTAANFMQQ